MKNSSDSKKEESVLKTILVGVFSTLLFIAGVFALGFVVVDVMSETGELTKRY